MTQFQPDIGNLHVIDWYLWRERKHHKASHVAAIWRRLHEWDFDIETEQREGWGYQR